MIRHAFLRHWKSGVGFLLSYFGFQIFGASLWPFLVISVHNWWQRISIGQIVSGLVGLVVFLWIKTYTTREKPDQRIIQDKEPEAIN